MTTRSLTETMTRPERATNTVEILNRQRRYHIDAEALRRAVRRVLRQAGCQGVELSLVLVSDRTMSSLNRTYRGIRGGTDVLSFSLREGEFADPASPLLGDVVVSLEKAAAQAGQRLETGHRPITGTRKRELALLVIHGVLHLLGHDHEDSEAEAAIMFAKEDRIFRQCHRAFPSFHDQPSRH